MSEVDQAHIIDARAAAHDATVQMIDTSKEGAWANIPPKRNRSDPICFGP